MKSSYPDKRYLVIMADRQKSRYFTTHLGKFDEDRVEESHFEDLVPQKVKAEHTRPGKVQDHIREHLHIHLKNVGKSAVDFLIKHRIRHIDGVIIGSHQELLSRIKQSLPSRLKHKVTGEFITDLKLSTEEVIEKIRNITKPSRVLT